MNQWVEDDAEAAVRHVRAIREPALRDSAIQHTIGALLDEFHVDLAERLFRQIQSPHDRALAAMDLHYYFDNRSTKDTDKADYYWDIYVHARDDE